MSEATNFVLDTLDDQHRDEPAATRRQIVAGAAAALGGAGALALAERAEAQSGLPNSRFNDAPNTPENIVNIAATAEVLATILNTVGAERVALDPTVRLNVQAAAREELIHFQVLTSSAVGARPATTRIWIPDAYLASPQAFLTALAVGDQVFINAYLIAVTVFGRAGGVRGGQFARYAAEFMGAEAVHRAVALGALPPLGPNARRIANDRVFMKFAQREETPGLPTTGQPGFYRITEAVTQLQALGFGFGQQGQTPGAFYEFDQVSRRTPDLPEVRTRRLS
jgi:hypothetical protein